MAFQGAYQWTTRGVKLAVRGCSQVHSLLVQTCSSIDCISDSWNVCNRPGLFGLNRYKDALRALARTDESNLAVCIQMGLCCEKLEQWEEAEENYRAVLENDLTYQTRYSMIALQNQNPFSADVHHTPLHEHCRGRIK